MTRSRMTRFGSWARVLALSMAVFTVDRATKLAAAAALPAGESVPVLPGIFHLTLVFNTGAAFGFLKDRRVVFIILSVLAIAALIYYAWKSGGAGYSLPLSSGLIVGGALGNLFDRIKFGYVIDFLDFRVWPVFNAADSAITVGVAILAVSMFRGMPRRTTQG